MPAASPPPKGWAHLRPCARRAGTASFRFSLHLGRRDTGPSIRAGPHTGPFIPVHERAPPESTPGRKILGLAPTGCRPPPGVTPARRENPSLTHRAMLASAPVMGLIALRRWSQA